MSATKIQYEAHLAKQFQFEMLDKQLVKLTPRNVALAEAMIQNDSAYTHSFDANYAPDKNGVAVHLRIGL